MINKILTGLCFMCLSILFIACSETKKASFDVVEQSRMQAKDNAVFNAQRWRKDSVKYTNLEIYSRGDSTISEQCPQGDGWASMTLIDKDTKSDVVKVKCSTVSMSLGCMEDNDFKTKAQAQEDGHCNTSIPFPLPKLTQ